MIVVAFAKTKHALKSFVLKVYNSPVTINQVLAMSTELAWIRLALVDLRLAQVARVPGIALTRETVLPVNARPPVTRIRLAVVDVRLTGQSRIAWWTFARVTGDCIMANAIILTRLRNTVVDVQLTPGPSKAACAVALEAVDLVQAEAPVQTRIRGALVNIDLALGARKSWHAHTPESTRIIQAASVVMAGMRFALVHVRLTPRTSESLGTVAGKRSGRIHADSIVLTRRSLFALVNILGTVDALVTRSTGARERPVYWTSVAYGVRMTGIRCTGIIQMAQQSSLSGGASAHERPNAVNTGGAIKARRTVAVVDVDAAIGSCPSVDADARVTADRVRACRSVLAHRGSVPLIDL